MNADIKFCPECKNTELEIGTMADDGNEQFKHCGLCGWTEQI